MVRLKKGEESFEIVDGPDAGLKFERHKHYAEAPKGYESRFENMTPDPVKALDPEPPAPVVKPKTRKGDES